LTKDHFKLIYEDHAEAIRSYIYYRSGDMNLSDDITQETFIKVWNKRHSIGFKTIKPLLYKISADLFIDHIRKQKHRESFSDEIRFRLKSYLEDSSENELWKEKCEKALLNLSEKERITFLMHKKDELPYKEIALRLNISIKAVEKRMSQALKKLKEIK